MILLFNNVNKTSKNTIKNPRPIDLQNRFGSKKEYKQIRRDWIKNMHRAAPGVDWQAMDRQIRDKKNTAKLSKRRSLLAKNQLDQQRATEHFANGITGSWIEKGSNNMSGRMHTVDVDFENNLIYAGSAGGNIWVSDLNGKGWRSINDFIQFDDILLVRRFPYNDGYRVIVVCSNRAAYTDNDGLTWELSDSLQVFKSRGYIYEGVIANDDSNSIFLLADESYKSTAIYQSTDLGQTFVKKYTFNNSNAFKCHIWTSQYENSNVYLIKQDTLYSFSNSSPLTKISTVDVQFDISSIENVAICGSKDATYLYLSYFVNGMSIIYRSTDGGLTWELRESVQDGIFTKRSFCCSQKNPENVYLGGLDAFRSWKGGNDWERINSWGQYYEDPKIKLHADIPEVISLLDNGGNEIIFISTDGGTYISTDDGWTVKNISLEGLRISQYYSTYTYRKSDTDFIYAGSQDQGIQRSTWETGGVIDFEQLLSGDYGHLVSGDGGVSLWGNYPGFVLYFPNITRSGNSYWWDFAELHNWLWMPPMCEHPTNSNEVYVGAGTSTSGSHLWHLKYSNELVTGIEGSFDFSDGNEWNTISAIGYSSLENNYLYVLTTEGQFYSSSDNGTSWSEASFNGPSGHYFYGSSIVCSPTVNGRVYIAGSGYSNPPVYISNDYGQTFSPMSDSLPATLVYDIDINPEGNVLFAATEVGPYAFVHSLNRWEDIAGVYAPDQTYWSVEYVPHLQTARFATYGRGIWDFNVESISSIDHQTAQVPDGYHLSNYPNPFNAQTRINYKIPSSDWVELTIYNSLGQTIRTLVSKHQTKGSYSITWDGRIDNGDRVSSGMYMYQLKTKNSNTMLTEKMLMIK